MERAEFDKFADEYGRLHGENIRLSGEAPAYFARYKMGDFSALARAVGIPDDGEFLDFGAGVCESVPFFREYFPKASLTCVDVSMRSLRIGALRFPGMANFLAFNGRSLPFRDGSFSGVFACCVFHHINEGEHEKLLAEIRRVLRPGACAMVYEHNPWNPLTVRAVTNCPFDENAVLIHASSLVRKLRAVGFQRVRLAFRVFFPHALRMFRPMETWLSWLPLGAQYYVLGVK